MKKTFKTLVMMFALTFGVLLFAGTESKAGEKGILTAAELNTVEVSITSCKQDVTNLKTDQVTVAWSAAFAGDCYGVFISPDGNTFYEQDTVTGVDDVIYNLSLDTAYYVVICSFKGQSYDDFNERTLIGRSDIIKVATAPEIGEVKNLVQTNATTNTISMKWDAVAGAVGYDLYFSDGNSGRKIATTTTNSYTVSGLAVSSSYRFAVVVRKMTKTGVVVLGETPYYTYSDYTGGFRTVPAKVLSTQITTLYSSLDVAYYGWNGVNNCDGYQFQLLNSKGKKLVNTYTTSNSIRLSPYYKGTATKARARAYITVGGVKKYGLWSDYNYNALSKKVTVTSKNRKITVKWKKVSGIADYTVYVSKKENSGWKKVKRVGSKTTKVVIKKCGKKKLKKRTRYYVKVVYRVKAGKKKVTSKAYTGGSIYVY